MKLSRLMLLLLAAVVFPLAGCGDSDHHVTDDTTPVRVTINWPARERAVAAPISALSAVITLQGAAPAGGDFSFTVNRQAATAHTETTTSQAEARVGAWPFTIRFFALPDGQGEVVGVVTGTVNLRADGTGLDTITADTETRITSLTVLGGQTVGIDQVTDLQFSARAADGSLVAITPGSISVTSDNPGVLQVLSDGRVRGVAAGTANVTISTDGVTSESAVVTVAVVAEGAEYTGVVLPQPGARRIRFANDLNLDGHAVGTTSVSQPWFYNGSTTVLLDAGPNDIGQAEAINDADVIAGQVDTAAAGSGELRYHAVIWRNGTRQDLGVAAGFTQSVSSDLNNQNWVVGYLQGDEPSDPLRAFVWRGSGQVEVIQPLAGDVHSLAVAINNSGVVVGTSSDDEGHIRVFRWTAAGGTVEVSGLTNVQAINDHGVILGTNAAGEPVLVDGAQTTVITVAGADTVRALDLGADGTVVGYSTAVGDNTAFVWRNGVVSSLAGVLGDPTVEIADAINARGQILGRNVGLFSTTAVLLTPTARG